MTASEARDQITDEELEPRMALVVYQDPDLLDDNETTGLDGKDLLLLQAEWLHDVSRGTPVHEARRKWELT
jgi:hypothetical protein